jgi:ATP-dependent Lhr-like helicase
LPSQLELGLAELIARGLLTCDSFGVLRQLLVPPSRRRFPLVATGRWSLLRAPEHGASAPGVAPPDAAAAFVAERLLERYGVVFRRLLAREKQPVAWRELLRVYRALELRGKVRGGRFVSGFSGEQYALPEATALLRQQRKRAEAGSREPVRVAAADPLNLRGIVTPDERVSPATRRWVEVG